MHIEASWQYTIHHSKSNLQLALVMKIIFDEICHESLHTTLLTLQQHTFYQLFKDDNTRNDTMPFQGF